MSEEEENKTIAEIEKEGKEAAKQEQAPEEVKEEVDILGDDEEVDVSSLLDELIYDAVVSKASDVHIEPTENNILIRYRVDGLLREVLKLDKDLESSFVFKIKVASRLRTDEHFAPQDGRISFKFEDTEVDTRVSILPTTKGEKIVIRLLTAKGKDFKLQDLGIQGRDLELVTKSYNKPYGMILAVGPTGSGKTTTLYTILKLLKSDDVNITTIENPVEYDIDGINHVQINTKADLTFANGLRSILRQDPDIIMVGEIRDNETARIAINAAMTGHLVLSTLHTNDAVTTIPRLIDMGIENFLVASTVNVIIAQRLARRLCDKCKKKKTLAAKDIEEIKKLRPDIASYLKPKASVHEAVGCAECTNTGYKGRVGIYEVLPVNKEVRKIIGYEGTADDIFKLAKKQGMTTMLEDGMAKIAEGVISVEELTRVTAIKE